LTVPKKEIITKITEWKKQADVYRERTDMSENTRTLCLGLSVAYEKVLGELEKLDCS